MKQYLEAEIGYVLSRIRQEDAVLELGCGYGRVLHPLMGKAKWAAGIDTSFESLLMAKELIGLAYFSPVMNMDAGFLGFRDRTFDIVLCIQNGISAFSIDRRALIEEAVRVTKLEGTVLFSSYSHRFWEDRLHWFRLQAKKGLIGEIDEEKTGQGIIVCKDGFRTSTVGPEEFISLTSGIGSKVTLTEVDGSSLFCEIRV